MVRMEGDGGDMHPEMYLTMQRMAEREAVERLGLRRPGPVRRSAGTRSGPVPSAGLLPQALASLRAAVAPSSCCAMA